MDKKKLKKYKKFKGFAFLGLSAVLIYGLAMSGLRVFEQRQELSRLQERKAELEKEKAELAELVGLLEDDDYVARYARDNYIFSKDGEEVVKLPESEE